MPTPTSEDVTQARAAGYREGLEAAAREVKAREVHAGTLAESPDICAISFADHTAAESALRSAWLAIRALAAPAAEPEMPRE